METRRTDEELKTLFYPIIEQIVAKIAQETFAQLNSSQHQLEHQYVQTLIEAEHRKSVMWQQIQTQLLGWGIIAVVGAVGTYIINHVHIWK